MMKAAVMVATDPDDIHHSFRDVRSWHIPAGSQRAKRGGIDLQDLHRERTAAFHGACLERGHSAYGQIVPIPAVPVT